MGNTEEAKRNRVSIIGKLFKRSLVLGLSKELYLYKNQAEFPIVWADLNKSQHDLRVEQNHFCVLWLFGGTFWTVTPSPFVIVHVNVSSSVIIMLTLPYFFFFCLFRQ